MTQDRNYLRMLKRTSPHSIRPQSRTGSRAGRAPSELLDAKDQLEDAKKLIDELSDSRDTWIEERHHCKRN
jgi:hypothetical protein